MAMSNKAKVSNLSYLTENVGTKVCRALFQKRYNDMRPQNENPATWTVDMFLNVNMRKIRILSLSQSSEEVLFPAEGKQTNIMSWDLSLVLKLLKATCELSEDLEKKVSDLQRLRNELAHLGDSNIDDAKYNRYVKHIQYIYDEVLKELKNKDFENTIQEMFRRSNAGEIPDYELLKAMQELQLSCDDIKQSEIKTRSIVQSEHDETRKKIEKGNTDLLSELKQIKSSLQDNGNLRQPTTVPVKLKHMNATNETDQHLTQVMVALFNEEIEKSQELRDLSNHTLAAFREAVHKFYTAFKEKGYEIVKAENGCILLHVKFVLIKSLFSFYADYISGDLDIYVEELEKASKGFLSFEEFRLEMILYEDDFCQVLHNLDIAEGNGKTILRKDHNEVVHNVFKPKMLYEQDGGAISILLTFKPTSHFDGKVFETLLESESKRLLHMFESDQSQTLKSTLIEEIEISGQEDDSFSAGFQKKKNAVGETENERQLKRQICFQKQENEKLRIENASLKEENDRLTQNLESVVQHDRKQFEENDVEKTNLLGENLQLKQKIDKLEKERRMMKEGLEPSNDGLIIGAFSGAAGGAIEGAKAGADVEKTFGPPGKVVGGILGGVFGGIFGNINNNK